MKKLNCEYCNKEFLTKAWNAKTCSSYCNTRNWRKNNPEKNIQIKRIWRRKNGVLERGSLELKRKISNDAKNYVARGSEHPNWKGDQVGYRSIHRWVERYLNKAKYCTNNPSHFSARFHWANISGEYKRDLSDWRQLCPACNYKDGVSMHPRFKEVI